MSFGYDWKDILDVTAEAISKMPHPAAIVAGKAIEVFLVGVEVFELITSFKDMKPFNEWTLISAAENIQSLIGEGRDVVESVYDLFS